MGNDSFFPKIAMNFAVPIFFATFFRGWASLKRNRIRKISFRILSDGISERFPPGKFPFQDEEYLKELVTTCTKKAPQISWLKGTSFEMVLLCPPKLGEN